jgi:hypothetical protein
LSTTSSSIRTKIRVTPSGLVVSNAVGPSLIVASFADDRDRAADRRRRIIQRDHPCHRVKKTWTVIRHARELGLADSLAAGALVVAMIEPTLVGGPVVGTSGALRLGPRDELARRSAEPLSAVAGPADTEHELAQRTALEAELLVHRLGTR